MQFGPKKQESMLEDLANLLEDGVTVNVALNLMIGFAHSDLEIEVIRQMQLKMAEGESFVLGLQGWCQDNLIEIIRAGEEGGTLVEAIRMAVTTVQQQNEVIGAILQGMTYPSVMFVAGLIMLVYIASTVFPNFIAIKPVEQWPAAGQTAIGLAFFVRDFWWAMVLGLVGIFFVLNYIIQNYI